jgi:DNA repair ATPase RecN
VSAGDEGIVRLQETLAQTRANAERGMHDLHRVMGRDLDEVRRKLERAERRLARVQERLERTRARVRRHRRRADRAVRRAGRAEAELATRKGMLRRSARTLMTAFTRRRRRDR